MELYIQITSEKKIPMRKKIDAFSAQSETLSALKVKCFQPNFAIFFTHFFITESETLSA
jgi:hypothetical protein